MKTSPSNPSPKLGSENDPIRQLLFASQSMKESLHGLEPHKGSPLQAFVDAANLVDKGMTEEAISVLHGILGIPNLETRVQLRVWSALRELGILPEPRDAREILGVVVEVPMQGAYDTLAAYQDGSARYLNFSGSAILWDRGDESIKALCHALLRSALSVGSRATPRSDLSLPKSGIRLTLLTRSGNYATSDLQESIVKTAALLMNEMIKRTMAARGKESQTKE